MQANPAFENLRQQIHCLEGVQRRFSRTIPVADAVDRRLPYGGLPVGCIHEIKGASLVSAIAFAAILSARAGGNIIYIAPDRSLCPLGLLPYGVNLNQILHVSTKSSLNRIWAVMEALRCPQSGSVVALIDDLDLTESRRLQLAAETSGATGFLIGNAAKGAIAAPITRWKISPVNGGSGRRFEEPVWSIDLLYSRGGLPGKWTLEWSGQKLSAFASPQVQQKPMQRALGG